MAEVRRDAFTEGLKADMYAYGFESYDSLETVHDKVFEVVGSDKAYEQSTQVVGAGELLEKPAGEKIVFESAMEGYTVWGKNRTFAKGIEFEMELVEDLSKDQITNIVRDYAKRWGERAVQKKEEFAAQFFNYGGYTSGYDTFNAKITGVTPSDAPTALLYDGKPFFNLTGNKRALYPGGTASYYNGVALDLSVTNLQTLYKLMANTNNIDSRGKKIGLKPTALLIPSDLIFAARVILNSQYLPGSTNNDINPVANLVSLIEWQYLTDTNAWFLGIPKKGIKFHNRKPLTFDFWQDEETKGYKASALARWGAHVYDWRYWAGSNFSTTA